MTAPAVLRDTGLVFTRELRPLVRDPFSVIFSMVQPLFFLALFGPLLADVTGLSTDIALQGFVPGIVVMAGLFGASTTGANLLLEMQTGSHERLLVTPLARSSLLIGRAFKEVVPSLVQTIVIVLAVVPFGFDVEPGGILLGIVILSVLSIGLGALSYVLAMASSGNDWMFWGVQQSLIFPLLLLAGVLLPLDGAPGWMKAIANANPLRHVVDAERALFAGDVYSADVVRGVVAALVVAAVGLTVGVRKVSSGAD